MTIIEWIEEAVTENTGGGYMSSERDRGDPINLALDEDNEYRIAIARWLNDEQVVAFRERVWKQNYIHIKLIQEEVRIKLPH